jgi:hypothetical protein
MQIDWNLSGPHTLDQVHWAEDRLDQYTTRLKPVESVRIRLPADKVFTMDKRASDVILYRRANGPNVLPGKEGRIVDRLEVSSDPLSVEDAYKLALGYAEQFGLSKAQVEGWHKRAKGDDPATNRTSTNMVYSANDKRPWVVIMELDWLGA